MMPHRAAFIDVDETLVTTNTLASLVEHLQPRKRAEPPVGPLCNARATLRRLALSGASRDERDLGTYKLYGGQPVGPVAAAGREWFAAACRRSGFFHQPVLAALREHHAHGDLVVLVSSSFAACLSPIARRVLADDVLCSVPRVACGVYTGEVDLLMSGAVKGAAVRRWMAEHGLPPAECYAYGRLASDLSMLLQVGHPVQVGTDEVLTEYADRGDWQRLPAVGGSPAGKLHIASR
jgi:HAD superfamily hydrolase (TIGR01490 family)